MSLEMWQLVILLIITDVSKCMVCDSEFTKRLPAEDGGNPSYYCEAHP